MKLSFIKNLLLVALIVPIVSCRSNQEAAHLQQSHFVKVEGTNFTIDGQPYYYIGTNFWYGAYLGADADYGNRERLIRELDHLRKLGIKNLRVAASSEESDFILPLDPPFQYKNGDYNETLMQGLDFLLAEMGKRDMRAILMLNNYWDWTGGMSQYVSWVTGEPVVDPTKDENSTWDDAIKFASRFYELEEAQDRYRKYIRMITDRENTFTNKLYKDDPTIMTWELANEPRPLKGGNDAENVRIFADWVHETAKLIHAQAPNHLVTTGSEGSKGTLNSLDFALQVHQSEFIDYTTFHLWPKNWGWYKADKPETIERTKKNTAAYIAEHIELSEKLNKPGILEEFGFVRDGEEASPESTVAARDEFYDYTFGLVRDHIKQGDAISGLNFWGWGGEGHAQQPDFMWKVGDTNYTADPYSEAQGLNSIFDTDTSTLFIISNYARELQEMSKKTRN